MRSNRMLTMLLTMVAGTFLMAAAAFAATVNIKTHQGIGSFLVDGKGMTLYLFKKDAPNKSVCSAANGCIEKWPVFFAEKVTAGAALKPTDFGTITREDGKMQTTYKGQPLYYYAKDKAVDNIYGQGLNNVWYVVTP